MLIYFIRRERFSKREGIGRKMPVFGPHDDAFSQEIDRENEKRRPSGMVAFLSRAEKDRGLTGRD
jgi:hypothetical protein